jgi:IAA-amino acid hydrolase
MGSEDFSFFSKRMTAALFLIGTVNETLKSHNPLHSPYFFIDVEALPIGTAFNAAAAGAAAISYLDSHVVESTHCNHEPPLLNFEEQVSAFEF